MIPTPERVQKNRIYSAFEGMGAAVIAGILFLAATRGTDQYGIYLLPIAAAAWGGIFWFRTRIYRRRRIILKHPFPEEDEFILNQYVAFYRSLNQPEKERFKQMFTIFLSEVRITGIRAEVDAETRVLVGASAIIPVFGFPDWEYAYLNEVLIYPSTFDDEFRFNTGGTISGMVGGHGTFSGVMVLSKPHLIHGFKDPRDKKNVGIHEFAHLVDRGDGSIDGLFPGMDSDMIKPWIGLVKETIDEGLAGKSELRDIRPYTYTNEKEFIASLSEYFFESPEQMKKKHPELYDNLSKMFHQDMKTRFKNAVKDIFSIKSGRIGRNSPCPCGSGKKYKKCCLRKKKKR